MQGVAAHPFTDRWLSSSGCKIESEVHSAARFFAMYMGDSSALVSLLLAILWVRGRRRGKCLPLDLDGEIPPVESAPPPTEPIETREFTGMLPTV